MAEFQDLQRKLSAAQRARDEAQQALARTTDRLAQVDSRLKSLERWANPNSEQGAAARAALEAERRRLAAQQEERGAALGRIAGELGDLAPIFWNEWSDPRRHAGQMNDDIPVMLFPLRLETRFKTVAADRGTRQQLWVRVYPDECLVDTFEETLSEAELDSASIFWREYFHAAGVETAERAAWRGLVAAHGSGRATWIIRQFRPLNPLVPGDPLGDASLELKPQSSAAGDVILVVSVAEALTAPENTALTAYWSSVWKSGGQAASDASALTALIAAVGNARATELAEEFRPYNLGEKPPTGFTRATATPRVSFLSLPKREEVDAKTRSWMKAATVTLLPERFVLLGYRGNTQVLNEISAPVQGPFSVSPDPTADPEVEFQFDEHGNLSLGEGLRWMTDFDEALRRGMGFRIDLTPQLAEGFDRLLVLGIRLGSDAAQAKSELEALFKNHHFSRAGFALLPQGAATNNTDDTNSAYTREDAADASYDFVFKGQAQFAETDDWLDKRDGQWLAESLGLDTEWLKQVPNAGGVDQSEARAMNTALWPATLGYFMDTLLQPVFTDDHIYYTRWFFNRFVSGRGPIPAIRIGRQPYGILPTTAFSRIQWVFGDERLSYRPYLTRFQEQRTTGFAEWLKGFKGTLDRLHTIWRNQAAGVSHVDVRNADPHRTLLDIVGLHPASIEFHQRYANTKEQEHNVAAVWQLFIPWQTLPANELHNEAFDLLVQLGYSRPQVPQLFDLFWKVSASRLNGPVIQEGPLSETDPLRIVTTDSRNYIEWLHEWARVSFDTVRVQDGFQNNQWPNALLYILLKHALELGYYDAGVRLLDDAQLLDNQAMLALRSEPFFFQVREPAAQTAADKSRYQLLYSPSQAVTGQSDVLLVDHITRSLGVLFGTRYLAEQLRALETLARTPTARLERLLAEHLDCCAYRLDAWMTGLVAFQLASTRYARRGDGEGVEQGASYRKGIYLGAYGWLENVRPEPRTLTPVRLQGELDEIFNQQQPEGVNVPLLRDDQNEGYIHAPSVNHGVTAAVLRNGYIANATPAQPELLKVNLSSERVRLAIGVIEGIRNGQSLAALLGYQFERGLHDRHTFAEVDQFIYPLRLVFPLYTQPQNLPAGVSIESVEARNVVNGLNLVRHVRNATAADKTYPFGFPVSKLPSATASQSLAIDNEVRRLLDLHDAVADLAIAEGVHQVVTGNYDRAAATLDAYSQATFPPIPDVVTTPRSGIALTHRVALHLDAAVVPAAGDAPRVKAEPAIDRWLRDVLPAPARVGCTVSYLDPVTSAVTPAIVTQADLALSALDLLYVMNPDNLQGRSEIEDRIRQHVLQEAALAVRPDLLRGVSYGEGAAGDFSFVEIAPLVRSLRALLLRSRPLRASDAALPTEARTEHDTSVALARTRVDFLPPALTAAKTGTLQTLKTQLDAVFPAAGPVTAVIVANIDSYLDDMLNVCQAIALFGLPDTGLAAFHESRAGLFTLLLKKAADLDERWQDKVDAFDAAMLTLPGAANEDERIAIILKAERQISTTETDPTGKTSAQVLTLVQAKETAFRARQLAFRSLRHTTQTTVGGLLAAFNALLPVTDFDAEPIDTADAEQRIVVVAEDIHNRTKQLTAAIEKRITGVQDLLTKHDGVSAPDERVGILGDAAKLVFGDEFVMVPSFTVPERQADEWTNAYDGRASLLDYQKTVLNNDFSVDDWLSGAARVRAKLYHVENLIFLTEAFGTTAPDLRPIQLPFSADAPWMALQFPAEARARLEKELLLYTAHYVQNFNGAQAQCGLLLDEWTEVIPAETETTGITFHFDKPNAEPPQAILLAMPSRFTGAWSWDDLVQTLHETLDFARVRAVEPRQLDQTALSVFLPATILATTWQPITIAADLSLVNKYVSKMS